jgi:hypothetical protein
MILAAIKSGTEPLAPLPPGAFHRTLEDPLYCPKCEATYLLVADYDWAISRHFETESRRHLALLRKAIFRGHAANHPVTHFESNGVTVIAHTAANTPLDLTTLNPTTKLLQ